MLTKTSTSSRSSASVWCAAMAAVVTMLATIPARAQSTSTYSEYAAKFLCGTPSTQTVSSEAIAAGQYTTSINIHNPNIFTSDKPLSFIKKAVIAKREGVTLIPPSAFMQARALERWDKQFVLLMPLFLYSAALDSRSGCSQRDSNSCRTPCMLGFF